MSNIKFGTDGWRARMGKDFSFKNVRIFAKSYAHYLKKTTKDSPLKVIVNFDTRFLSRKFAEETAKILSLEDIQTYIPERDIPLAPVSLAVIQNRFNGAINFTASVSKPIYNGIKVFSSRGVSALPAETAQIEKEIERIAGNYVFKPQYANRELIEKIDFQGPYLEYIESLVDFNLIRESGLKIVVDNLFGTSREYLDYVLMKNDIDVHAIRNSPNSPFEGVVSTLDVNSLKELSDTVKETEANIGLATDIDGDRFGIIDSHGKFITSNMIMPSLIEYLIRIRKMEGGVVTSVSATHNIRRAAEHYGREVYTTPVGFKYLADVLAMRKAFVGVESTNGASLNSTVNVKDGILFCLLAAEMTAYYKKDLRHIIDDFQRRFSRLYDLEVSLSKTDHRLKNYRKLITIEKDWFDFDNLKIKKVEHLDGIKFHFDHSWLLIRSSGTSDVIRLYAEAKRLKDAQRLIKLGRRLIERK